MYFALSQESLCWFCWYNG